MTTLYEFNSPPIKAAAWTFEIVLYDSNGAIVKTPTLAAGDFKLSKDGGATANITSLPAEIGTSGVLTVSVSTAEHNADRLCLICEDQAGDEWQSAVFEWRTVAAATVSDGTEVTLSAAAVTEVQSGLSTFDPTSDTVANVTTVQTVVNPVTTAGSGSGSVTYVYNITSSVTGLPIEGVTVNVSTDIAGANIVAASITDSFGNCTFYLDPGDYYFWSYKDGWVFTNPDLESVS